jgi:diguanylate cyclase (GGDEF)-like protein
VQEQGGPRSHAVLRFRQHRVQQALHATTGETALQARHLALARRLAPIERFATEAAEQYLPVLAAIADAAEAGRAATLFASAAGQAARLFRHDAAERYAGAAIRLREAEPAPDAAELTRLRTARLTALYSLGRYDDSDRLFADFGERDGDPLALAEATCVQLLSLGGRGRHTEAVPIGLAMLARLGIARPAADLAAYVARGLAGLLDWVTQDAAILTADRRTTDDPLVRVTARLINRILPTAQLHDPLTGAWLAVENQRLWARHGACPELVANLARTASSPIVFGEDYRTAYAMARHAIGIGIAFGYEPETSLARQNFATFASHWFEPLENTLDHVSAARPGLVQGGEIQAVCINDISCLAALLDCAPALENSAAELATARDYATRTGHHHLLDIFASHHQLLRMLTGEIDAATRLATPPNPAIAAKPLALFGFHCGQAIAAALFADDAGLAANSAAAARLTSRMGGAYRCMIANLLQSLSLAREARRNGAASLPVAFQALRAWFAARAADAPGNFEHLLNFIDAEAAWTLGDNHAAARAFDRALQTSTVRTRPWHHALIAERAGLFHLAHGMDYLGRALLRDARSCYAAWGAQGIVRRLAATHGFLADSPGRVAVTADGQTASLTSDAIDLLAILRASQALSSQTTIAALYAQVVETLATMTGATSVRLVVWDESRGTWCLPAQGDLAAEPVDAAAARGSLPLSAFRIVERTHLPLLVDDATLDDRFARDPYFARLDRCSLLVLPVRSQGAAHAVLMLENRLSGGVFSHARLNLVTLVASQLAVSLDNARLYASLEQRVAERTQALAVANRRLEQLSISDALTGLANRRRFDDVFAGEWLRALRGSSSLGLVLVDIDHFKLYNDHYGHVGGDRCLRAVATALHMSVRRDVDLAARYGGEEFALILPGADLRAAAAAAARAHQAVLALREPHAASPLHGVTVSLGVAALIPEDSIGAEQLIRTADAALYRAKQAGRNRLATAMDLQTAAACAVAG